MNQEIQNSTLLNKIKGNIMFYDINNQNDSIFLINDDSNANCINQNNINNYTQKKVEKGINQDDLPKFKKYDKSDLKFKEFVPKDNLFYCFLAEVNRPSYRAISYL